MHTHIEVRLRRNTMFFATFISDGYKMPVYENTRVYLCSIARNISRMTKSGIISVERGMSHLIWSFRQHFRGGEGTDPSLISAAGKTNITVYRI